MSWRWWVKEFQDRTGWKQIKEHLLDRKIPEAKGCKGWLYTLGSAALFIFFLQIMTGILLAMNYAPSPDHAYDSIKFITDEALFGGVIRGLHKWGATFMIVAVLIHLLRIYFMGSYKYPRELTWMTGIVLFFLVLAFGFTGYLLPWDQKAYWATQVGVRIVEQVPYLGPALMKLIQGGEELGAVTLTRFYAFHVLALPVLFVMFLGVHLFLVVWHGISEPPEKGTEWMSGNKK